VPETFVIRVIDNNRITIPQEVVDLMKLKKGDLIRCTIDRAKEEK
jgi:bifunctional DNA-binding transcriptional regulator/antitoxin component of YhaV-PrlF toxin-antitoxin module